jgi:hypothetical protein
MQPRNFIFLGGQNNYAYINYRIILTILFLLLLHLGKSFSKLKLLKSYLLLFTVSQGRGGHRAGTGGFGPNLEKMYETEWAIWRPNSDRIWVRFGRFSGQAVNPVHGLGQNGLDFFKIGPKWPFLYNFNQFFFVHLIIKKLNWA